MRAIAVPPTGDRVALAIRIAADACCGRERYVRLMRRIWAGVPIADIGLACGLLVGRLVALATGVQPGGGLLSYLLAPLLTLPLAARRRHPLAVALVVMGTDIAEVGLAGYHDSVVVLVVFLVVPYSLAVHAATWRGMLAGLAGTVAAGVVSQTAAPGAPHTAAGWASTFAGDAALVFVPFFVGLLLRQQRLRAQTLEALAVQLEREREERARSAVAEERTRIARELHDEVAHAMSVIAVQADAAEGALARDPMLVQQPLTAIRDTARGALADMRRMLGALHSDEPLALAPEPGLARVGTLIEQARAGGVHVILRIEGEPAPLPPLVDLAAYRVVQEGLTNVRKHSAARCVEVVIHYTTEAVAVDVTDDGDGTGDGAGSGHGLAGIRERVALLGGDFVAGPRTQGFALRVTLPLA